MRLIVVVKGYPRLSETFIAQELAALERRGWPLVIVSLRHPTDQITHPVHEAIKAPVIYLPEYLHRQPLRVLRGVISAIGRPGFTGLLSLLMRDLRRDPSRSRLRRWGQALVLAREVIEPRDVLYAHFLHTPASVTRYAAHLRELPFGVSAHAKDIWLSPEWEKREKLVDCAWAVTCTALNQRHLNGLLQPGPRKVTLVYHGLELPAWSPPEREPRQPGAPFRLLCVARAVPKKGLDLLLRALADLGPDLDWRLAHIGGGSESRRLERLARDLGIADHIDWRGPQPADRVRAAYREADLFVLPSRIADDGDRDGLPNVLMEAMSQRTPVLSTAVSAIPELVRDNVSGRLVPPDNPAALTAAILELAGDPAQRERLANAARAEIEARFDMERGIDRLEDAIREGIGLPQPAAAA